ncbi:MAG: glycosyltransferase family 2 protein [Verrucomicrobiota bacterium]
MTEISIVVPVYKAEETLDELIRRLTNSLSELTQDFEIVLVEDHGRDRSWEMIAKHAKDDPRIKGIKFCRNFGQHYALTAGLNFAAGAWVVTMDCDLQDQPEEIPKLYAKAQEGYDVVLARRIEQDGSVGNKLSSRLFYKVFDYLADTQTDHAVGNFRILSRKVVKSFRDMPEHHRFFGGMIQWMGFRTTSIDVTHSERIAGKSSYNFFRRLSLAVDAMVSFSNKPLELSIKLGAATFCLSIVYAGYLFYKKMVHSVPVDGYTSIMLSLLFLGSVIIINLGIIGAYIGRIYDQSKGRPTYIIEETTFPD